MLGTWEVRVPGRSGVWGHPRLHGKFRVDLCYMRPCLKGKHVNVLCLNCQEILYFKIDGTLNCRQGAVRTLRCIGQDPYPWECRAPCRRWWADSSHTVIQGWLLFVCLFVFEAESHYYPSVDQAAWNSKEFTCLGLQSAGVEGMSHHTWHSIIQFLNSACHNTYSVVKTERWLVEQTAH